MRHGGGAEDGTILPDKSENGIGVRGVDNFPTHVQNYDEYGGRKYNEIAIARYNEAGDPARPDAILSPGSTVNDIRMIPKLHAACFDVPIILVDESRYEYPVSEEEKIEKIAWSEGRIKDLEHWIDSEIIKEVKAYEDSLGDLSEKDLDEWNESERMDNPELYLLIQKKKMIEISPESEEDKKDRIDNYEKEFQVIIREEIGDFRRSMELENIDNATAEKELRILEEFCRELATTPRSEWTREQIKRCRVEVTNHKRIMEIARDLELLRQAAPLGDEERAVQLGDISVSMKKQIVKDVSSLEQKLRSLTNTLPEKWSEEDKNSEEKLYSIFRVLHASRESTRRLVEKYNDSSTSNSES